MGRFSITLQVANRGDVIKATEGSLADERVRRVTMRGAVDSGAGRLVLPEAVVQQLGLPLGDKAKVRLCGRPDADTRYGPGRSSRDRGP